MRLLNTLISKQTLALMFAVWPVATPSQAQTNAPESKPQRITPIEVTAPSPQEIERQSITAKTVVGRDEIAKFGARSVTDALRQISGVAIVGVPGKDPEIRLRGVGGGYVQILINGAPTAVGFSIDSIPINTIERIEILPIGLAEQRSQGVAGSINVITRAISASATRSMRLSAGGHIGYPAASIDGQWGHKFGPVDFGITGALARDSNANYFDTTFFSRDSAGQLQSQSILSKNEPIDIVSASIAPRLSWKPTQHDTLNLETTIRVSKVSADLTASRASLIGSPSLSLYPTDAVSVRFDTGDARTRLMWVRNWGGGTRLQNSVSWNVSRRTQEIERLGFSDSRTVLLNDNTVGDSTDHQFLMSSQLRYPWRDKHVISVGIDAESNQRDETRIQRQRAPIGFPREDRDDIFATKVTRAAAYAQDEWDVSPAWSVYLGLRGEQVGTETTGADFTPVARDFTLASPIVQSVYKISEKNKEQIRFALSRTYKLPTARELIPRRWTHGDNGATQPVFQGNPLLRPERALGIDASYERALSAIGSMKFSAGLREIDDVVLSRTLRVKNEFIQTPTNFGSARVATFGIDGSVNTKTIDSAMPDIDVRASLYINRSEVKNVMARNNRLDAQLPFTFTLGLDYRVQSMPLTFGASLQAQGGATYQLTPELLQEKSTTRNVDLYGLWRIDPKSNVRLAVSNVLHRPSLLDIVFTDAIGQLTENRITRSFTKVRLTYEHRF